MKFKLIIIVALAVFIISTGTVSADENTTHDETLKLDSTPGEIQGIDTNDSVLTVGEDSFTSLQNTINLAAPEDNITLGEDYVYNTGFSTDGISITKSVFINGQGHTINAGSQSRAFTIAADNVVLKDLSIINSGSGGAVTITGNNVLLDNVTFNGCHSTGNGGAVHSTGKNTGIFNSAFIGCDSASGGALYLGNTATVSGSQFINCSSDNDAGAIHINAVCNISNCLFDHNIAVEGGDIYLAGSGCSIIACNFTGSHASGNGGAVRTMNVAFTIIGCQFISCVSQQNGGAVYMGPNSSGSIMGCNFTGDRAVNGGAVYSMGDYCPITGGIFQECRATDGGAVYANGKANATGSIFQNNHAVSLGGAIYNCIHSDCVFDSNTEPEIYLDEEFRENLTMTIDVSGASFGEDIIVLVHVEPSVSLNATAYISDTIKVFEIVNGTGILNISGLNAGAYVLTVTVNSTMEYNSCSNSTMFSVMKVQPVIEIIADDIYYGDDAEILVNLSDDATGMVELYVNGAVINLTIIAGKASILIPGLEVGTYAVTASYAGDLNYNGCSNTTTFKVMHNTFLQLQTIIDDDTTGEITLDRDYYGEGSEITISKTITINGNGHTLDAKGLSRIFTIAADNVVLKDLSIINSGSGGAVTITGNNVLLDNVTFNSCHSTGNGGAVHSTGNNTGIFNSAFIGCHSTGNGGAVHSTGKDTLILNSAFIGCDSASGGALYLGNTAAVYLSQFINCSSDNDAGAIHINAACNISNCLFDHNSAVEGGDIYLAGSPCNITDCNFTGSHASGNGGAVRTMNVTLTIMDCQFTSCVSQQNGGAVYMGPNSSGSIMACTFTECTADGDGGAVHFMGEECEISDTIFTECTADGDGGAVHFMGEECEISDTIFTECTAEYGGGGAVYANGKANATGSLFTNNFADGFGGAIYNCMHSDCVFESNTEPEIYFDEEFRQNLTMNITASNVNFGEDIIVLVHVEPSVSLNATAVISGTAVISDTIKVFEIVNGTGILHISGLNAGEYVLTVTVNSTMEYNSCSNSTMFSVMKVPPVIEIIANDIYYGDDAAILVNLPDGATGMVELYVNGAVINLTINDEGKASTVIPGLEAGTYYVTASYAGDLNYNACSNNATTFKVMHNTFSQLQTIIDDDTTGEITLDRDYCGEGSEITISKSITINGNGHTLDAKGLSRIFNVQSGTVVLDNLSLVNGNSDSYGGAAYFQSGSTCTVRNCNFTGNTAKDDGGAVYFYEHGTVTNSTFTANSAKKGGAIYSNGNSDTVNSTFIDNSADLGGAIYNCDYEICTFTGNSQPDFYFDEQYRKNVTMGVNVLEIMMGEDLRVIISFDQDITGNVTVNIDGVDMCVPIVNRTGNLLVHGLSAGAHNLTASFNGNFEYRQCNVVMDVTVLKKKVSVNIGTVNIQFGDVETVNVQLNESIEGIATVEITKRGSYLANGTVMGNNFSMNYTITLINGSASLSISDLTVGEYTATVHYLGDGNYAEANATINFTVSKRDLNVLVDFSNEDKTITFTPQANVAGVSVEIAGSIYEIAANVGTTIYLNDLASGNYTYIITYPGGDAYNPYMSSANITISRLPVNVTVNADNITYGQTQNVTAIVPDGATSMVNFILSRDENIIANTTSPVVNGVASYEIPQLNAGTYRLRASYLGDSMYEASSFYEKRFKVDPNIDVSPKVKIGDDGKIVIEVGDITGRISVFVDDAEDGSKPINNNRFTYYLVTEDYSVGYHNLTFEYIGSDLDENVFKKWDSGAQKYLPVKYLINITQRPTETVLDSDSDQMFVVVLEDDDGKLQSNATGNVTFTILDEYANVVAEEVVCVVNGIATLDISKYKNGNYVIQWNYSGDEKHTPITRQVSLSIIHKASRINAGDVKITYTQSSWYSVTLYGNDGKPLSNARVEFLIGNKVIGRVNTNANGVAGVSISSNPGTYSLSIKAPGKTVTKKLTVEHIVSLKTVKIKRSAKKLVLTATLKKINGKYLKGKRITFKFNGKKYSAKTNKKGVAKVTIKKNVLKKLKKGKKVTYQATYLKDTVKKKSKVKK